ESVPGGQFGAVKDLSLISSSGVSSGGQPISQPGDFGHIKDLSLISTSGVSSSGQSNVGSSPGDFGHVSDLSLISSNTATAAMDAITNGRKKALDEGQFDDETEAQKRKPVEIEEQTGHTDLPAVAQPRADLPSVARKGPQIQRKTGQVGMGASGQSPMI